MSPSDSFFIFYSIIVGLSSMVYIKKWAELLQMRYYSLYVTVPLLWSFVFLVRLLNEWFLHASWKADTSLFSFLMVLLVPFIYYCIGMLMFPSKEMLDRKDKFAYLDYYEHFRQNSSFVMGLAIGAFFLKFVDLWLLLDGHLSFIETFWTYITFQFNYLVLLILVIAFLGEHKGLMCVLAYLLIFIWFITGASTVLLH